jgi:hypothetical protein
MTIGNVSSASESAPSQEQVSVVREDDGLVSISISADAGATVNADSESASESTTGAEQAKSDVDGTNTSYPTNKIGGGDDAGFHSEELLTSLEDLSAKIKDVIKLLGGLSGGSTANETLSTSGDAPVDTSQTNTDEIDNTELAERIEGIVADLEQIISELRSSETGAGNSGQSAEDKFVSVYYNLDDEGQAEVVELLASGEFGEFGVQIAELLPSMHIRSGDQDHRYSGVEYQVKGLLEDSGVAEEILSAIEPIIEEHSHGEGDPPGGHPPPSSGV